MEEKMTGGRNLLVFAVCISIAFLVLLYGSVFKGIPMGINVLLFIAVNYGCLLAAFPKKFAYALRQSAFQTAAVVLLGVTYLLYNNPFLLGINGVLIVLLVGAQIRLMLKGKEEAMVTFEGLGDACVVWFGYTFAGMKGAFDQMGKNKKAGGAAGLVIGFAVAVPLTAAVIALLMSADLAFSDLLESVFRDLAIEDIVGYSVAGIAVFCCAAGLHSSLGTRKPAARFREDTVWRLSSVALRLLAGCLDAVLAVFAVLQFVYLFAGKVPEGVTYAMYAQNGFWQLVAVAVIVIAIVWISKKSIRVEKGSERSLRVMLSVLCALTEVILVSAFWRMALYEQAYSFSVLRIFTQAFMVAVAGVFAVLALSLWRDGFRYKKWIFIVGMCCYLALNFMNVDGFIAKQNCAIGKEKTDVLYLTQLSCDALPYYADKLETAVRASLDEYLEGTDDARADYRYYVMCRGLARIKEGIEKAEGWQYANVGREEAKKLVLQYADLFEDAEQHTKTCGYQTWF